VVRDHYLGRAHHAWLVGCDPAVPLDGAREPTTEAWFAERAEGMLRGCLLDVFVESGTLYDPDNVFLFRGSEWPLFRTRPFVLPLPAPASLPDAPEAWLDELAGEVLSRPAPPEIDGRMRPEADHARPHLDLSLVHGTTFHDVRPSLARAMALDPAYREWARERLEREGQRELAEIAERIRARVPGTSPDQARTAAGESEEGRRVILRMAQPTDHDLARWLGAWLGDVSAHDLFVAWEGRAVRAALAEGRPSGPSGEAGRSPSRPRHGTAGEVPFEDRWRALRRVFFAPSYGRVLVPFRPVRDDDGDRIGFWRVVLPRPSWMLPRVDGRFDDPDWNGLPLDLVPDLPLAYMALGDALDREPRLRSRAAELGLAEGEVDVHYESRVKPRRQRPATAFDEARIELRVANAEGVALVLTADVRLERPERRPVFVERSVRGLGDDELARLAVLASR
jgi:hypothetical protein